MSKYGVFSGPYFHAFGLNTERYGVPLRIQSECGKIGTGKKLCKVTIKNANVPEKTPYLDTFHAVNRNQVFSAFEHVSSRVSNVMDIIPENRPQLYQTSFDKDK